MFPHRVRSAWEVIAPAKLNLYLDVLGVRADGFHELETLLVPVRVYDQLQWTDSTELYLRVRSYLPEPGSLPSGSDNLVLRAAQLLAEAAGVQARGAFTLVKRIPVQAGMGGGSSDAAAALLLANAAWGVGYDRERLSALAAELGSDVPYFIQSGPAICRGRGERVEPVPGLPRMHFVVVKPNLNLSTAEVYGQWRQQEVGVSSGLTGLLAALRSGALAKAGKFMVNRLEAAAAQLTDGFGRIKAELQRQGCRGCLLTGSGSACFGLVQTAHEARRVARVLSGKDLGNVIAVASC